MDILAGVIAALLLLAWLDSHRPVERDRLWMMGPTMRERRRR